MRRRGDWWAGVVLGADPGARATGLRARDVAVVAVDPRRRAVVWIGDVVHVGPDSADSVAHAAEAVTAGSGRVWLDDLEAQAAARAWHAVRQAHARARLGAACGLPPAMCRRISGDAPGTIRRAIRAWLDGEENLAVQLVRSAIAERVATRQPGYGRHAGDREASQRPECGPPRGGVRG